MTKKECILMFAAMFAVLILGFFAGMSAQKGVQLQSVLDARESNNCPYEGAECPNAKAAMKDYQLVIQLHDYVLMDGDRVVGTLKQKGELDDLVMADNE